MRTARVLTAASGPPWEALLAARCADGRQGIEVVARCTDAGDLRARLVLDRPTAVVVDAGADCLEAVTLEACRSARAAVVVVGDPRDPRPARLGCNAVVDPSRVDAIVDAVRASILPSARGQRRRGLAGGAGVVVAVWGPKGGTGRTTVAVNLGWELALAGYGCVVVDADTTGGNVALDLGLAEAPSIARLAQAAGRGLADDGCLEGFPRPIAGLTVVPGPSRAADWPQVRDADLRVMLGALRRLAAVVVVDVGACLEDDDELLTQAWPWRRNQAARAVLADADVVAAVVACDPASARNAVAAREEIAGLTDPVRVVVVVNKVVEHRRAGADVASQLERRCGWRGGSHLLPLDTAAPLSAWAGRALAETAPQSPLRRGVAGLARGLAAGLRSRCPVATEPIPHQKRRTPA